MESSTGDLLLRNFAHDNDLQVDYVDGALCAPESLTEPHARMRGEPQEPV
jgi:hypothetical protein